MKIYNTVKTEERALEIINGYVIKNRLTPGNVGLSSCRCECGETQCRTWSIDGEIKILVAFCDSCGGDDAFESEVLNTF